MEKNHLICVLHADGSSEWFCGWDTHGSPDLSFDRDDASKYDLMFHRDECMDDYARLCELGFDASIETSGFVRRDYSEVARLEHVFASVIVRGATLQAAE
ncbi:hypothetical protein ELI01_18905 [Rhizobium leguminosarum]|uniref:hypothetical protein n=1 Tax=Rhizobium leguminosarum TaxID=384 RepID=UPI001032330F|nr:hypothetical protein [Rhizobium leguminosarum]TAX57148.1 hypothetical protein ELI01_18905 [Rhizobium leguminosarum]